MGMNGNVFCRITRALGTAALLPVRFKDRKVYLRLDAGDQMPAGIEAGPNSTLVEGVDET
jgi:hypothetical protein